MSNPENIPNELNLPFSALISLAVEHWRLENWLKPVAEASGAAPARYSIRKVGDFLKQCRIEARSLDGLAFDAGLAVTVIDVIEDAALPANSAVVERTLSPMVLWCDRVVRSAEVITRRGPSTT